MRWDEDEDFADDRPVDPDREAREDELWLERKHEARRRAEADAAALAALEASEARREAVGRAPVAPASKRSEKRAVREQLADFTERNYHRLEEFFDRALNASKTVRLACPRCGVNSAVEVPDWQGSLKVVEAMLNQGFGRPPAEAAEGGSGFVLRRTLVFPDGFERVTHDEAATVEEAA